MSGKDNYEIPKHAPSVGVILTNHDARIEALERNGGPGLYDFFATSALSILANSHTAHMTPLIIAQVAYDIAEAMMSERKKRNVR
jgi:hypothetical protein